MELYAKYIKNSLNPQTCDYYFETRQDFNNRKNAIIAENNNDLSQKTFGFGDGVTDLSNAFTNTSITSTPKMIVAKNVTDLSDCFLNCSSFKSIQQGLFDNCPNATNFGGCFNLTGITSIPADLFDKCPNATSFNSCFGGCGSLTIIPEVLFNKNVNVTDFSSCFSGCALTTIPTGLFDNCPNVTNFGGCFFNCMGLTTVPAGLFDKNVNVTDFWNCFYDCSLITSALPDVWNKQKFPKVTDGTDYALHCHRAAKYKEIPYNFGGPAPAV